MKTYTCMFGCGHEVTTSEVPQDIRWTDGHICKFKEFNPSPGEEIILPDDPRWETLGNDE